jgi:Fur family ferric uptake transcriptional regulator
MTAPREAIVSVLEASKEHLSAEDVYLKVHDQYPRIGLTTVYRNLELLLHMGILSKFAFGDGRARYELKHGPDGEAVHHHHLVCRECGRVINYTEFIDEELAFLKLAEKGLAKKYAFEIDDHLIQFLGRCEKCQSKKK